MNRLLPELIPDDPEWHADVFEVLYEAMGWRQFQASLREMGLSGEQAEDVLDSLAVRQEGREE